MGVFVAVLAGVLSVGVCNKEDKISPSPSPPRRLNIFWTDLAAAPSAFAGMAREVTSVFGRQGVTVTWRVLQAGEETTDAGDAITVILLEKPAKGSLNPRTMGAVLKPGSSADRKIWVFLSAVLETLGLDGRSGWSAIETHRISRAVGRVVVHEILHLLNPERSHTGRGLMARYLDRAALTQPVVDIDKKFLLNLAKTWPAESLAQGSQGAADGQCAPEKAPCSESSGCSESPRSLG